MPADQLKARQPKSSSGMGKVYLVYIMANRKHGAVYTGVTGNPAGRIWQHKNHAFPGSFTDQYDCDKAGVLRLFCAINISRESCFTLPMSWATLRAGGTMNYSIILTGLISVSLCACASSSVTQLSRNTAMISTSAAPVCRTSGAASVANQMAAVATINAGYDRFIVGGFGTTNNTRVVSTGPTYATTTGSFNRVGSTVYGTANTSYGGASTFVAGSNDAEMQILMLNSGDRGFEEGIDARAALGPDWQKKVDGGINNCF